MHGADAVELAPQPTAEGKALMDPMAHLEDMTRQRDEAVSACTDLARESARQAMALIRARRERDGLVRHLAADHRDAAEARRLIELALHLCKHGENAPGGTETWEKFARDAETFLRWGVGGPEGKAPQMLFGGDAGPEWEHQDCSWPERACTGHATSYQPVRVPENTGKHPGESPQKGTKA